MSKHTHTRGEWIVGAIVGDRMVIEDLNSTVAYDRKTSGSYSIVCPKKEGRIDEFDTIGTLFYNQSYNSILKNDETLANAYLIAAAPELLDIVKRLVDLQNDDSLTGSVRQDIMNDLIAEATDIIKKAEVEL